MDWSLATTSSDSRIAATWQALRTRRRTALIPYLTAGFPDRAQSLDAIRAIAAHADILEVGVPYSDPLADGPTIQASTFQSLAQGMSLLGTLELIHEAQLDIPVVLFSYLNPILQYGIDRLLSDIEGSSIAGILLTDLPVGADPLVEDAVAASPIDLIRLVAPTTEAARLRQVVDGATGFLYVIARLGVTGASQGLASGLAASIERVRQVTPLPIAVGFGVSTPEQACAVAAVADGVIIGSALVDVLGREGVASAERFLGGIRAAIDAR
jgi:tryptophan synthase alpha chain